MCRLIGVLVFCIFFKSVLGFFLKIFNVLGVSEIGCICENIIKYCDIVINLFVMLFVLYGGGEIYIFDFIVMLLLIY